jgi:anti-anti-sigma factor
MLSSGLGLDQDREYEAVTSSIETISVSGRVTNFSAQALFDHVMALAQGGRHSAIILDMNQVQFIDSFSIGQLVLMKDEVEKRNVHFEVDAKTGAVAKMLALCHLTDMLAAPHADTPPKPLPPATNVCVQDGLVVEELSSSRSRISFRLAGTANMDIGHALSYIHKCAGGGVSEIHIHVGGITNWSGRQAQAFRDFIDYCADSGVSVTVTGQDGTL